MDNRIVAVMLLIILAASSVPAQNAFTEWALKDMQWRIESIVKLLLCTIWAITAATLTIVVIVSGIRYLTSQDADEKDKAKKNIKQGFVGLMIIVAACPFVNYLVHGTDVAEFKCDCIPLPPPTTTTTTTTTIPTGAPGTRPTTTTSTTTTTTVTTYPKTGGGRFIVVGKSYPAYGDKIIGVIFNMDGSIHKPEFVIETLKGLQSSYLIPEICLSVGPNRFLVAYFSHAVILDWEGNTIKKEFTTRQGYNPAKAIYENGNFYLALVPEDGGKTIIQVYDMEGSLKNTYTLDIEKVFWIGSLNQVLSGANQVLSGAYQHIDLDMAYANKKLFIVWFSNSTLFSSSTSAVYGAIYDLEGKKIKDKFKIIDSECNCIDPGYDYVGGYCAVVGSIYSSYENPNIEVGGKYFLVTAGGKMFFYDKETGSLVKQTDAPWKCVNDLVYGDGKFLATQHNDAYFYNEEGNKIAEGQFGGHGDAETHLAYGNKMYVGAVAVHMAEGDGLGVSFLDKDGTHVLDTFVSQKLVELPGWPAYDW